MMFSYLITFHMNNGHTYETVLIGKNLDDIKEKLYETLRMEKQLSHFDLKDNKNVQFTIVYENISAIEFELLSEEGILLFKELVSLSTEDLTHVFSHVANDFVIGISLLHSDKLFIDQIYNCLPSNRKEMIAGIIQLELGKIKMTDVLQAQYEILQIVESLYDKGEIRIDFKDIPR